MKSHTALKHLGIDPLAVKTIRKEYENYRYNIEVIHFNKDRERVKTTAIIQNSKILYRSTR